MRSDHDIFQTFEGDNTVLLQQVAATLLKQYRQQFKGAPLTSTYRFLGQVGQGSEGAARDLGIIIFRDFCVWTACLACCSACPSL